MCLPTLPVRPPRKSKSSLIRLSPTHQSWPSCLLIDSPAVPFSVPPRTSFPISPIAQLSIPFFPLPYPFFSSSHSFQDWSSIQCWQLSILLSHLSPPVSGGVATPHPTFDRLRLREPDLRRPTPLAKPADNSIPPAPLLAHPALKQYISHQINGGSISRPTIVGLSHSLPFIRQTY